MPKAKTIRKKQTNSQAVTREVVDFLMGVPEISEAFTQADIELALDDRGWLVGGQKMHGELDSLSRTVQINRARYFWLRDPLAKQAVRLWTDYGLGDTAISYQCDDTKVQTKLDKFMKDRRNRKLLSAAGMRRLSNKLLIDGDIYFAVFTDGVIRTVDPLQITDIVSDPDDEETTLVYKRVTADNKVMYYQDWAVESDAALKAIDPTTKRVIDESKVVADCVMYQVPFDAFAKRGNGLLSSVTGWTREHRRFMEARVAITQALAKFAYKTTIKGGQAKLNKIKASLESTFVQSGTQGGVERQPQNAPGANWLQNEGMDLVPMPRVTGAAEARDDADGLKLMVSAGTGIMLHYFGDPSTGNLATSTAMELPMLKQFGGYQKLWKDVMRDIFAIILEEGPDDTPASIDIDLPPILADDLQKLGTFLTGLAAVFPEVKIPAILQMCLVSLGVNNVDEVMKDIDKKRKELDAAALALPPAPGAPGALPAGAPSQQLALKESYDNLSTALLRMAAKL